MLTRLIDVSLLSRLHAKHWKYGKFCSFLWHLKPKVFSFRGVPDALIMESAAVRRCGFASDHSPRFAQFLINDWTHYLTLNHCKMPYCGLTDWHCTQMKTTRSWWQTTHNAALSRTSDRVMSDLTAASPASLYYVRTSTLYLRRNWLVNIWCSLSPLAAICRWLINQLSSLYAYE